MSEGDANPEGDGAQEVCDWQREVVERRPVPKGLTPWPKGVSGNPTGRNQYSYRRDWEAEVQRRLKGAVNGDKTTVLQTMVDKLLVEAQKGKPWAMKEVLKRVWPETVKHEHRNTTAPPAFSPLENLNDEDRATMLRLAQKAVRGGSE